MTWASSRTAGIPKLRQRARWAPLAFVVAAAAFCATGSPAYAQGKSADKAANDQRARELFLKGDAAYAEGRYEEALTAFKEAYELSGRPQLLFNVSNAAERLGRYADAVDALEKYLASGKAKDQAVVKKRLVNLRKRVEEEKKEEEERRAKEAEEKKKRDAQKTKDQEELAKALAAGKEQPPPPPPPPPAPVLPWILIGGGAVVAGTGAAFGVLTLAARNDVSTRCTDTAAGHLCDQDARSALDREQTFGIVADVGVLTGLVLGGVGTYLLLTSKQEQVYLSARAMRGGGGVQVGGHF